jgi:hypothetical protein
MARKRRRTAQSRPPRATSERSSEEIREVARARASDRLKSAPRCPRCSSPLPPNPSGRGRPRVWCSQACRRAAYEERRAASNGAIATQVVVQRVEPTWDETMTRVLDSPVACRQLLTHLRHRLEAGQLQQAQWDSVRAALLSLAAAHGSARSSHPRDTGWVTLPGKP